MIENKNYTKKGGASKFSAIGKALGSAPKALAYSASAALPAVGTAAAVSPPFASAIGTAASTVGSSMATTFAPLGTFAANAGLGASALGIAGTIGPIVGAVIGGLAISKGLYNVIEKEKMKKRIKSFVKIEILNSLKRIIQKDYHKYKEGNKRTIYHIYYEDINKIVKFMNEYDVFNKLTEVFIKMDSGMFGFFPSQKLMHPINFDGLNTNNELFKSFPLGSNFTAFYDYMTGKYVYFTCDQINGADYNFYIRINLVNN